jgi:6-phosphofructokinase 1
VAEGAHPAEGTMDYQTGAIDRFGHERFQGIGTALAFELERRLGKEAKPVILGHVQRGGTPTAYDRVLATRFGWHAVEAAHRGVSGRMTALRGTEIEMVPLAEAVAELKTVPKDRMDEAESVF